MTKQTKAYIALVFICIVWGTTYFAIRVGVAHYPAFLFAAIRQIAAGAILIPVALMANRHDFEVAVNRAPGSLYTVDADGGVRNTYLLRVTNNSPEGLTGPFQLHITGMPGDAEVITAPLTIPPSEQITVPLIVRVPAGEVIPRALPITVHVEAPFDRVSVHTTFMSGGSVTPES